MLAAPLSEVEGQARIAFAYVPIMYVRTYAVELFCVTKTRFCLLQHGTLRSYVCRFCARRAQKTTNEKRVSIALPKAQSANCVSPIMYSMVALGATMLYMA
jgi:hypothetical protein